MHCNMDHFTDLFLKTGTFRNFLGSAWRYSRTNLIKLREQLAIPICTTGKFREAVLLFC